MSAVFPKCKAKWMRKDPAAVDLDGDDIRVMLVKATYVYDPDHEVLSDLGEVDNGRSGPLDGKSVSDLAVFDAEDTELDAVGAVESNALIIFKHTGNDATAELVAHIDDAVGLPDIPAPGQPVPIMWNNGHDKVFRF